MITGVARAAQHSSLAQQLAFGLEDTEFLSFSRCYNTLGPPGMAKYKPSALSANK